METQWKIDPTHSQIGFRVKHMMFTTVSGTFDKYDATITAQDDSFENAKVQFSADADSVNTGNADRDQHLRSADFFNAEANPKIEFDGTLSKTGSGHQLSGNLSMNGKSQQVTLPVEFGGIMKDPWGNDKAVMAIEGKISRKDWGLTWNSALEAGGVLVSDEVKVAIELQLVKA